MIPIIKMLDLKNYPIDTTKPFTKIFGDAYHRLVMRRHLDQLPESAQAYKKMFNKYQYAKQKALPNYRRKQKLIETMSNDEFNKVLTATCCS